MSEVIRLIKATYKAPINLENEFTGNSRITYMRAGLQLWFGKMVGVSLSYNGINLKRSVNGDLHSSWKDVYGQSKETIYKDQELFGDVTKIRKLAPGFSIAPINNEKYMVKFAYNQIKYTEDEGEYYGNYYGVPMYASPKIDLLVRNFELGGHVILQDANKKYVIGAWYKASRIKNNAPTGNKYEYSNDKLDYFQISFGFKF